MEPSNFEVSKKLKSDDQIFSKICPNVVTSVYSSSRCQTVAAITCMSLRASANTPENAVFAMLYVLNLTFTKVS